MKKEKAEEELKGKGAGKKEKKAYDMPGQKHDPPENVCGCLVQCVHCSFGIQIRCDKNLFFLFLIILIRFILQRDPSRIFYESLHEQVPGSEMAAIW